MKSVKIIFSILAAATVMVACNDVDFKKTKGGVAYKLFPGKGSKDSIVPGNVVKYHVIRKVVGTGKKDTVIQNTYESMPQFEDVRASTGTYFDAFSEMLSQAHVGDSIYFEQAIDSFIAKQPDLETSTPFRKGDKLVSSLRIIKVFKTQDEAQADFMNERKVNAVKIEEQEMKGFKNSQEAQKQMTIDNGIIEEYLKKNNIQTEKSPWGAYVQVINPGTGAKPSYGQFVQIKYAGTTLEGVEFDSGVYPLQFGTGGSIKGFEEGARFLGKGGKAKVFVPSMLAYGPRGSGDKIKPNEILVFDMEILDITENQAPQRPALPDTGSHEGHNH